MEKLIIGAVAAKKHFPDFRDTDEVDYALRLPDGPDYSNKKVNAYWIPELWHGYHKSLYASPDILYTIAVSRNEFMPSDKLKKDIEFFEGKGCQIVDSVHQALKRRYSNVKNN